MLNAITGSAGELGTVRKPYLKVPEYEQLLL